MVGVSTADWKVGPKLLVIYSTLLVDSFVRDFLSDYGRKRRISLVSELYVSYFMSSASSPDSPSPRIRPASAQAAADHQHNFPPYSSLATIQVFA